MYYLKIFCVIQPYSLLFKVESNDSKVFDDFQKIIEIACNKEDISHDLKKMVIIYILINFNHKNISPNIQNKKNTEDSF